jgi:hypothetical protein
VQCPFLIWKPAIFRKVKEIKHLSGGVVLYAAQANVQIDAEIAEKGGFWTETSYQ